MTKTNYVKRGLSDLLVENEIQNIGKEEVIEIDLAAIEPNPFQPRKHFDVEAMKELAESIRINGVLQPIIVKKVLNGYLLVAGERRVRAAKMAGFSAIPAIVRDYNTRYLAELALLENIQREDLTIIEEAEAYRNAINSMNITHLELAQKVGKSRSYISNTLGILTLPEAIVNEINNGRISMGHARALSKLEDGNRILQIASMIVANKMTVRDIEALVKKEKKKKVIKQQVVSFELAKGLSDIKLSLDMILKFDCPIKVVNNKVVITFASDEEVRNFIKLLSISQGDEKE
ncbi:MAG: ParB/RepB/Spo0J family partition protein [Candidatus Izemoplasmatales bacterium]|jgi:ParB family chromosome partitioning protein|nr:ParB/RepB/Spo0J family partition protein [Candidatus Izemoplasmatales bacterium]